MCQIKINCFENIKATVNLVAGKRFFSADNTNGIL